MKGASHLFADRSWARDNDRDIITARTKVEELYKSRIEDDIAPWNKTLEVDYSFN
jgi:hypothetical protein